MPAALGSRAGGRGEDEKGHLNFLAAVSVPQPPCPQQNLSTN